MTEQASTTMIEAAVYMYFVAAGGGFGLLTVVAIGYKMYKRGLNKTANKINKKNKRGAAA